MRRVLRVGFLTLWFPLACAFRIERIDLQQSDLAPTVVASQLAAHGKRGSSGPDSANRRSSCALETGGRGKTETERFLAALGMTGRKQAAAW
jgi:hypothetical protein